MISAFLDHLEADRHNSPRSRNARLAALRSLFRYAALRHPEHAQLIQVLAIPQKRYDKATASFLQSGEVDALLAAPDLTRWEGRRGRPLIALAVQTGLRLSELTSLRCGDAQLGAGAHVRCTGKGRKQRCVPLTTATAAIVRAWQRERGGVRDDPLFPTRTGRRLSDDAVEARIAVHKATADQRCPSLAAKKLTPHTLRHTAAMTLAARRDRRRRHRPVAWPRRHPLHRRLPPRRHEHQGTGARPRDAALRQAGPLPATRQPARVPGDPVIIPNPRAPGTIRSPP